MPKLLITTTLLVLALLAPVSPAVSGPVRQLTIEDDVSFQSRRWSAACGFSVFVTLQGTIHVSLRTDRSGTVHEIDAYEDWSLTFSAPSTGRSFTFKFGPAFFEYPDGVDVGSPAIQTFTGIQGQSPGGPAFAGRVVVPGTIVFVSSDGIPFVETTGPAVTSTGRILTAEQVEALTCAALS